MREVVKTRRHPENERVLQAFVTALALTSTGAGKFSSGLTLFPSLNKKA